MSTYWVSTTGNDSNLGTQAAPLATIQRAVDLLKAGDHCKVLAGSYAGFCAMAVGAEHAGNLYVESASGLPDVTIDRPGPNNASGALVEFEMAGHWTLINLVIAAGSVDGIFADNSFGLYINTCSVRRNGRDGARTFNCAHFVSNGTAWAGNGEDGLNISGLQIPRNPNNINYDSLKIVGGMTCGNGRNGIKLDGGAGNASVASMEIENNLGYGIEVGTMAGVLTLTGNTFAGNGLGDRN